MENQFLETMHPQSASGHEFVPDVAAPASGEELESRAKKVGQRLKELKDKGFQYVAVESTISFKLDVDSIDLDPKTKELHGFKMLRVPHQTKTEIIEKYLGQEGAVGSAKLKGKVTAVELVESSVDRNQILVFVSYN